MIILIFLRLKYLGMKNPLHRKRLQLHLQLEINNNKNDSGELNDFSALNLIDNHWITSKNTLINIFMASNKKFFISFCLF